MEEKKNDLLLYDGRLYHHVDQFFLKKKKKIINKTKYYDK